jgi:hypothetical protein
MTDVASERISTIICGASWSWMIENPTHVDFDDEGNARVWNGLELLVVIRHEVFEDESFIAPKGLD